MDVEAQVISLVGEMEPGARDRVVAYLHSRYQDQASERVTKAVARKVIAGRTARASDAPISVSKASLITRVSKPRLYGWIKQGQLKATPGEPWRGRQTVLVSVADIQALVEERQ